MGDLTGEESARFLHLRAVEWANWPSFLSMLYVPVLLIAVPWLAVLDVAEDRSIRCRCPLASIREMNSSSGDVQKCQIPACAVVIGSLTVPG